MPCAAAVKPSPMTLRLTLQQDIPAICKDPKRVGGKFPAWLDPSSIQDCLGDLILFHTSLIPWSLLSKFQIIVRLSLQKNQLMGYLLDECIACCESLS